MRYFSPQPTIFDSAHITYFLYAWDVLTPQPTFYSGIFIAYLCMIFFCTKMRQVRPFHISLPITHFIIYHYQKEKKKVFCNAKVIEGREAPEGPLRVLFRFLSDEVLLSFLSDRNLFETSVIGSSSGSSVIDSSLGSSVFFFCHAAISNQNVLLLFFIKSRYHVLHYILKNKFTLDN